MTWILAHWGGGLPFYGLMKKEAPEILNKVYFDTAASPYLYRPAIYRLAAEMVGPDKDPLRQRLPPAAPSRYLKIWTRRSAGRLAGDDFGEEFGAVDGDLAVSYQRSAFS